MACLLEYRLEGQRQAATMVVVSPRILSAGIGYHLPYGATSTWNVPYVSYNLVNQHRAALTCLSSLRLQGVIAAIYHGEQAVCLTLMAEQPAIELHPLCTGQRRRLHILGTLHDGDVYLLDLAVTA